MEKERSVKILIISILFMLIAGLTVAFAALSTTLNIKGTAYLDAAKWGIKFENLSEPVKVGNASVVGTSKIEETKSAEITGINVSLSTPGDKVTYTVDLVNEGTINAKIDNIEKTVLTSEQQRYLTFKVTDRDGKEVSEGDILSKGETRNLTITIEFIKDLTKEDLPKQTSTTSLSYKLNFVQTDEKATTSGSSKQACTTFDKKDTYNVGDVIALCNTTTNKSEDFYVISDNGSTVTAFAKYNLLVGNTVVYNDDFSDMTVTPISTSEEGYGLQNSIAGYVWWDSEGNQINHTIKGTIAFADGEESKKVSDRCSGLGCYYGYWTDNTSSHNLLSKYGTSYPANVFDSNSNLYKPLENYKTYLKNTLGKTSITTKIMTYEDLISLGCNESEQTCESAPSFVYNTNYWTAVADRNNYVWDVNSDGVFGGSYFGYSGSGLRPVITISKSDI